MRPANDEAAASVGRLALQLQQALQPGGVHEGDRSEVDIDVAGRKRAECGAHHVDLGKIDLP